MENIPDFFFFFFGEMELLKIVELNSTIKWGAQFNNN